MNLYVNEKIPRTIKTSWNTAATAPRENCHRLNLNKIYKNTTTREPITAKKDDCLMSSAIVGLTLPDIILPTSFSASKN